MIRAVVLAALALALSAADASAYVRSQDSSTDACLFWPTRAVGWQLNEAGEAGLSFAELETAVVQSFDAWERVSCSDLGFRYDGTTARRDVGFDPARGDNINLLVWREGRCSEVVARSDACWSRGDCASRHGCWSHSSSVIALTTTSYNRNTGVIVDSDIEFNAVDYRFTVADGARCTGPLQTSCVSTDVRNTATHEIGHFIGFDHTPDREATMYDRAPEGETSKRTLGATDVEGLCAVYPAGMMVRTCTRSGEIAVNQAGQDSGGGCDCGTAGSGAVALVGLLLALARRASRQRPHS